jgi:hypothetical protein
MKLGAGKIGIPGVTSRTTSLVMHLELVADRVITFLEFGMKQALVP